MNPDKLKLHHKHSRREIYFSVAVRGDSAFLGCSDFSVHRANLSDEKPEFEPVAKHGSYVTSVSLAGDRLVSGGYDGKLIWTDAEAGTAIRSVDAHSKWIRTVRTSPDGSLIASVADDMVCRLWDADTGKMVREMRGHAGTTPNHFTSMLYAVAFSAEGERIATGDKTGKIVVWETDTGKEVTTLEAPVMYTWDPKQRIHSIGGVRSLAFSPDGKTLAVGGMGQVGNIDHLGGKARIVAFDWEKGERTLEHESGKFKGLVERLTFSPDGTWLCAAGGDNDGFLIFLDPAGDGGKGKVSREEKFDSHVHDAAFSDDFSRLYLAAHGKAAVFTLG